jgi:hypothetical protein
LEEIYKAREDEEEEEVRSFCFTLRKRRNTGN